MNPAQLKRLLKKNEPRGRKRKYNFDDMTVGKIKVFGGTYPKSLLYCAKNYIDSEKQKGNELNWQFRVWQHGTLTKIVRVK